MKINPKVVTKGLLTFTNWFSAHSVWNCGMALAMESSFEESYAVRAMIKAGKILGLGRTEKVAHACCDRYLQFQGVHEKDMFDMGYGYNIDDKGMVACSCVADAASVAASIIETVMAYPDYPGNSAYLDSVRRYIDYVLETYTTEEGVIGVGILSHQVNPMRTYWCANALFTEVLVLFAAATGETKYFDAAVAPCEYLALFDYKNTQWKEWDSSPSEVILYTSSGVLQGLSSPEMKKRLAIKPKGVLRESGFAQAEDGVKEASNKLTAQEMTIANYNENKTVYELLHARWKEFSEWLYKNQDATGYYTQPHTKNARSYEAGLSWTLCNAYRSGLAGEEALAAIGRQLSIFCTDNAKIYLALFANDFATSLAYLSFAAAAEMLAENMGEEFQLMLEDGMLCPEKYVW